MNASSPVDPPARAHGAYPKQPFMKVVMGTVVGLSSMLASAKDFWRGYSQSGTSRRNEGLHGCRRLAS